MHLRRALGPFSRMRPRLPSHLCFTRPLPVSTLPLRNLSQLAQKTEPSKTTIDHPSETKHDPKPDPFTLVAPELSILRGNLLSLLGSAHADLRDVAGFYLLNPSKLLRSLLVFLFSKATNGLGRNWETQRWNAERDRVSGHLQELDRPLWFHDILPDSNPNMSDATESFANVFSLRHPVSPSPLDPLLSCPPLTHTHFSPCLASPSVILPGQMRLAHIAEMINIASIFHDGISDHVQNNRPESEGFGNKLSILGGDFLLGRASMALSHLGDSEVVELISVVISNLVEGEILRMDVIKTPKLGIIRRPKATKDAWDLYLRKTYLKTASLMAKSARSAVILGGAIDGDVSKEIAYAYGRNLGIAFQLTEDARAYESGLSALNPGIATGPALYACEEHSLLEPLIQRSFIEQHDLELTLTYVRKSSGIERTHILAAAYAAEARDILQLLPDSHSKVALEVLTDIVVKRTTC